MTAVVLAWGLLVWCIAAVLVAVAWSAVRRYVGRHTPHASTAALPDLIDKEQ